MKVQRKKKKGTLAKKKKATPSKYEIDGRVYAPWLDKKSGGNRELSKGYSMKRGSSTPRNALFTFWDQRPMIRATTWLVRAFPMCCVVVHGIHVCILFLV
jgi:hypothetical protein